MNTKEIEKYILSIRPELNKKELRLHLKPQTFTNSLEAKKKLYNEMNNNFMENKALNSIKRRTGHLLYTLLTAVLLWVAISTIIQAFKCPEMSQTELFLRIPKSFICAWEHCS